MTNRDDNSSCCSSLERLKLVIDNLGDCISVKNREHRFMYANEAFLRTKGFAQREDILGKTLQEIIPGELAATLYEQEERIFESGNESLSEEEYTDSNGLQRVNFVKKTVIDDKDGRLMVVLSRDITEYRQMYNQVFQAQKMESLGFLAGKIAHDFNNLLNVINGYSEMILEELEEDSPVREDVEKIRAAGQSAAALTSQLRILGQKPKQGAQRELLNLNEIIEGVSAVIEPILGNGIRFERELTPTPGVISADSGDIRQILINLADNARDAMPDGGSLTLTTSNVDIDETMARKQPDVQPGCFLRLSVRDTGTGMDADTKRRMFDPFFTTKGKGKGTGLGLSGVYGIVKQSGGFIEVRSEPGKGSEFKIYFPTS